jgi:glycerol-3-phosphate dehydrogenase
MAATPVDFFIRRTGAMFFDRKWVEKWQQPVIDIMAKLLHWNADQKNKHTLELKKELKNAVVPIDQQ